MKEQPQNPAVPEAQHLPAGTAWWLPRVCRVRAQTLERLPAGTAWWLPRVCRVRMQTFASFMLLTTILPENHTNLHAIFSVILQRKLK